MLRITLIALLCATVYAFPPEHLDHVVHDYAEGIENLKRTARDIKFIDSDGDVIKIIKSEPLIGKYIVIFLPFINTFSAPTAKFYFHIHSKLLFV